MRGQRPAELGTRGSGSPSFVTLWSRRDGRRPIDHPRRGRWLSEAAYGFPPGEGVIRSTSLSAFMSTGLTMW